MLYIVNRLRWRIGEKTGKTLVEHSRGCLGRLWEGWWKNGIWFSRKTPPPRIYVHEYVCARIPVSFVGLLEFFFALPSSCLYAPRHFSFIISLFSAVHGTLLGQVRDLLLERGGVEIRWRFSWIFYAPSKVALYAGDGRSIGENLFSIFS